MRGFQWNWKRYLRRGHPLGESAAIEHLRSQIDKLARSQAPIYVSGESGDVDILACVVSAGVACVQVFFIRHGVNLGNKLFFPRIPGGSKAEDVLSAFEI